jgi:hypothetical protein
MLEETSPYRHAEPRPDVGCSRDADDGRSRAVGAIAVAADPAGRRRAHPTGRDLSFILPPWLGRQRPPTRMIPGRWFC